MAAQMISFLLLSEIAIPAKYSTTSESKNETKRAYKEKKRGKFLIMR